MYLYRTAYVGYFITHNYYDRVDHIVNYTNHVPVEYLGMVTSTQSLISLVLRNGGKADDLDELMDDYSKNYSRLDGFDECDYIVICS